MGMSPKMPGVPKYHVVFNKHFCLHPNRPIYHPCLSSVLEGSPNFETHLDVGVAPFRSNSGNLPNMQMSFLFAIFCHGVQNPLPLTICLLYLQDSKHLQTLQQNTSKYIL